MNSQVARRRRKSTSMSTEDAHGGGGTKRKYSFLSYNELPEYLKDNEFILNHYRVDWPFKEAFFSLFSCHNDLLNVWTHLLGFLLFLALTIANLVNFSQLPDFITIFTKYLPNNNGGENFSNKDMTKSNDMDITSWPFFVFLSGAMFCFLSSSICHLFWCHSKHMNLLLLRIDYVGIAVIIITAAFPPIYYMFQCSPHWQLAYSFGITVLGVCIIITLLNPTLSTAKYRLLRAMLFMSLSLFGITAGVHALVVNWTDPHRNIILGYESAMVLFLLTGTVLYLSRIPERWKPGCFDIIGHSHQIFHVFVLMSAVAHYSAAKIFLEYHGKLGCQLRT